MSRGAGEAHRHPAWSAPLGVKVVHGRVTLPESQTWTPILGSKWTVHPVPQFPTSVFLDDVGGWWGHVALTWEGTGESFGLLCLLTSLCLSLPLFMLCDDCDPLFLGTQKKIPMTVSGSPHTLKPLKPPCLATQGKSWKKRRKVRCPSSDGLPHEAAGWGLHSLLSLCCLCSGHGVEWHYVYLKMPAVRFHAKRHSSL